MTDPDQLVRVPRIATASAVVAAVAAALVAACSATPPNGGASPTVTVAPPTAHPPAPPSAPSGAPTTTDRAGAPAGCDDLLAAVVEAGRAADAARERKADAWKLVVPFAVLARRAQAGHELEAAERQRAALQAQAALAGCSGGR